MRNVFITGATGGLGKAIVQKFIDEGDHVIAVDMNATGLSELQAQYGAQLTPMELDITKAADVQKAIEKIIAIKQLHVVINNAGVQHRDKVEDFPEERWDLLQNVMLKAPFLITKYVFPHMKEHQFGRIINISSVHGILASPEKAAYVAAKHGVLGLTKVTALEGAAFNITVNAVLPGPVKTPLLQKQLEDLAASEGLSEKEALEKIAYPKQAMQRFIAPEEIADGVYFLSSQAASGITGESLNISGGM